MTKTKRKELPEEIKVPLTSPVKFARAGATEDVFEVTVNCHSRKHYKKTLRIQQLLTKGFFDFSQLVGEGSQDLDDKDDTGTLDPAQVTMVLKSTNVDLEELTDRFEKLAMTGVVTVEGTPLNPLQLAAMDPEELELVMTVYLANFIAPLVMKVFGGK